MADLENAKEVKATPQIRLSDVIQMITEGKDRKEIAAHYGKPMSVMTATVFKHPSIKNLRTIKERDFEIVDDLGEETVVIHASKMITGTEEKKETTTEDVMNSEVVAEEVSAENVEEVAQEVFDPIEEAAQRLEEVLEDSREESGAIAESSVTTEEAFERNPATNAVESNFPQGNWGETAQQ